jgi:hypothetical protein
MAWLPAGPTASEAAEIILLLVVVPFLRSFSLCVHFRCPVTVLLVHLAPVELDAATPYEDGYPFKDRLRFLCDRDTRGTIPSASHSIGAWIQVHYNSTLRRYLCVCDCKL